MEEDEVNIRYEYVYDHIEDPKWDKKQYFEENGIKSVQGPVYFKKQGKIEGIVFQGYRSRIERDLKKGGSSWDTSRSLNIENLFVGMDIYVIETNDDKDTVKRQNNQRSELEEN